MKRIKLAKMNPELVAEEIGNFIVKSITSINFKGGVIGLSGGIDSTATAALAKKAFDKHNLNAKNKLELIGYIMPSLINNPEDTKDAIKVAEKLKIKYEIIDIQPIIESYKKTNIDTFKFDYHKGNLMAEIRAVILHQKAATEKKLVIGTGNKDEDFGVGYYTLFGDGAVHISPIGNLPKRLVKELAIYLGFKDLSNKIPTAGLEPGQTDFKDLGYDYELVELVTNGISQGLTFEEIINENQVKKLAEDNIKRYSSMYKKKKFPDVNSIVKDIIKRNNIAKAKSEILHPPTARITLTYN